MTQKYFYKIFISLTLIVFNIELSMAANDNFEIINYTTEDGGIIEAYVDVFTTIR